MRSRSSREYSEDLHTDSRLLRHQIIQGLCLEDRTDSPLTSEGICWRCNVSMDDVRRLNFLNYRQSGSVGTKSSNSVLEQSSVTMFQ